MMPDYGTSVFFLLFEHARTERSRPAPGCKRIIFDRDASYLKCLHKPNMKLNFDGIRKIVEGGLITKKGKRHLHLAPAHSLIFCEGEFCPFDVLIFATGYATVSSALSSPLREFILSGFV